MKRSYATPALLAALAGTALLLSATRGTFRRRRRRSAGCRVVVIGAGFGGLHAALRLAGEPGVDLTVIDTHNHHLFQLLLYQVATAALAPSDIASPLRGTIPADGSTRVLVGSVTGMTRHPGMSPGTAAAFPMTSSSSRPAPRRATSATTIGRGRRRG